jgi:hypothetical protein
VLVVSKKDRGEGGRGKKNEESREGMRRRRDGRRGCHVTLYTHLSITHSKVVISWRYGWVSVSAETCT